MILDSYPNQNQKLSQVSAQDSVAHIEAVKAALVEMSHQYIVTLVIVFSEIFASYPKGVLSA